MDESNNSPEWLPNWRYAESYELPSLSNKRLWAWEFLRRNPQYQETWNRWYINGPLNWVTEIHEHLEDVDLNHEIVQQAKASMQGWRLMPMPLDRSETSCEDGESFKAVFIGPEIAEQFNLTTPNLCDPAVNNPEPVQIKFKKNPGARFSHWLHGDTPHEIEDLKVRSPQDFVVQFDLSRNIEKQWNAISPFIEQFKRRMEEEDDFTRFTNRPRVKHFPSYIRVLDAKLEGASSDDIAAIIFPDRINEVAQYSGRRAVENAYDAAKRIRDDTYRHLLEPSE